ncbi:BTB/POZ domain-containing protein At4g08455 isoform X4 [Cryptomeria japonica]|uniref:BTB/POZ domain-containing protein At4g08455 isoform X4 n=1 Tax=Cryptomeria japonica TaxID=3369 RepID=UPI0027DAB2D3|nr:BTB/POZ domain-containing protein At4g08455 isoform X4 [Cryptomeria japonica]
MQHIKANSHLLCNSCDRELGFIRRNINVAQFLYCDECVKAQKFHPDHEFLQTWDKDVFLQPFADLSLEGSDGGILRAHKAVMAGKSKVFKTMLRAGMPESVCGKAKISDMTVEELRPLINFLYTGRVNQRSLECHSVALYRASHNEGFVESNPPALVLKTVRTASKFDCFAEYRKKNFKEVSFLMELAIYRIADHLDGPHKGAEELNEVVSKLYADYEDDELDAKEQEVSPSMDTSS